MLRAPCTIALSLLVGALAPAVVGGLAAQGISDLCQGAGADDAALAGTVMDADSEMALPGATVVATWEADGPRQQTTVQSAVDGSYVLCGLRSGLSVSLRASVATLRGDERIVELGEGVTRQDLTLSLGIASSNEDRRLIMCPDFEFPHLIDCEPGQYLERCGHEKMGRVETGRAGAALDTQETVEQFIFEVKRLRADAVINVDVQHRYGGLWRIEGMAIKLADPTCRAGGG